MSERPLQLFAGCDRACTALPVKKHLETRDQDKNSLLLKDMRGSTIHLLLKAQSRNYLSPSSLITAKFITSLITF